MPLIPTVIKKSGVSERGYDIFSHLLEERIVFIGTPIDDMIANLVVAQLLFLQSQNRSQDIHLYVNSPGGIITAGLAIYDTMQLVSCDVATYVVGQAFSLGAILLAAGAKGKRHALPHARVMLHQPWGGLQGTAVDISIHAEEMVTMRGWLNDILAHHTGQPVEKIEADVDRDFYMSAQQAKEYGIVDEVLAEPERKESS
jgi:ATP-dependent Clp protease protease subunit